MLDRIFYLNYLVIAFAVTSFVGLGFFIFEDSSSNAPCLKNIPKQKHPSICFDGLGDSLTFDLQYASAASDLTFYSIPSKPGSSEKLYGLRSKKSGQFKIIQQQSQIGFDYRGGFFFNDQGPHFLTWQLKENLGCFKAFLGPDRIPFDLKEIPLESCRNQNLQDIPKTSLISSLEQIQWIGQDVLCKKFLPFCEEFRLSFSENEILSLTPQRFLVFADGKFSIQEMLSGPYMLLASVVSMDEKGLALDVWTNDEYARVYITPSCATARPMNFDFLTSVRVRSEKHVSCFIDKQPFVVKMGDILIKNDTKWKLVRSMEEKQLLMEGKLLSDVFIFDHIEHKANVAYMCGYLTNKYHTQMVYGEIPSMSTKRSREN